MKKFWFLLLHLISLPTLILIGCTTIIAAQRPSLGIYWTYSSGIVYELDTTHPSAGGFQVGDRIVSGDGFATAQLYQLPGKKLGDVVDLVVERGGVQRTIQAKIVESSLAAIISRLLPLAVALIFWISGSVVLAFSHSGNQAILFFLVCQSAVLALSAGTVSSYGPNWMKSLFQSMILWLSLFAVHLHLAFPTRMIKRSTRLVWLGLGVPTAVLSLIFILQNDFGIHWLPMPTLWRATFVEVGVNTVMVLYALIRSYRKSRSASERHQVGVIFLSGPIGILPFVFFTVIPQLIVGHPLLPFNISFASLLVLPVGYGYSFFRYRLGGIEKTINRGTSYVLIFLAMAGIYSLWYSLSVRFISPTITQSPLWVLSSTVALAGITCKLYQVFTKLVNVVLYGGWYDYQSVVGNVSISLNTADLDSDVVGAAFCQVIGRSMRLECAYLVLPGGMAFTYLDNRPVQPKQLNPVQSDKFFSQVSECGGLSEMFIPWRTVALDELSCDCNRKEKQAQYVIPLKGKGKHLLGILVLGRKCDGERLDENDLEILRDVIHQAQVTLENVRLLDEVRAHSEKISRLHRKVLRAREEERKRVARDLHDLIIQSLVGINYRIAEMRVDPKNLRDEDFVLSQAELRQVIIDLRQICADLRPSSLDVSGITAAIQSKVADIEENAPFQIRVLIEGNEDQDIAEDSKICVYRLVQESLTNIQKHAQADHVELWVQITSENMIVTITDNGVGFDVPQHLDFLTHEKHFGLVGLKELVESVNGTLEIVSRPGEGCVLTAQVPV